MSVSDIITSALTPVDIRNVKRLYASFLGEEVFKE